MSNDIRDILTNARTIIDESFPGLDAKTLERLYLAEAGDLHILFESVPGSIQRMRSSYLPSDMFNSNMDALKSALGSMSGLVSSLMSDEAVMDSQGLRESNENTFMRMLGMPMSDAEELQSGSLATVSPDTGTLENSVDTMFVVEPTILDERQRGLGIRLVKINSNIFSFKSLTEGAASNLSMIDTPLESDLTDVATEEDALLSAAGQLKANLGKVQQPKEFFKFSYLLFPPIQDARISRCINETDKIVASPFSSTMGRTINGSRTKQSFLESVIRIRLDRATGTQWRPESEIPEEEPIIDFGLDDDDDENKISYSDVVNQWGLVELIIIDRLNGMLYQLADQLAETVYNLYEAQAEGWFKVEEDQDLRDSSPPGNRSPAAGDAPTLSDMANQTIELSALKKAKVIEDAILLFFGGKNSASLDLQADTQRNSGLMDGHLMGPTLSIIRSVSKGIDSRIDDINTSRKRQSKEPERKISDADTTIGASVGVGPIDVIAFILALFTINEEDLMGLLSKEQYENLLSSELSYFIDEKNPPKKKDMRESLNTLSDQIYSVYMIFLGYLSSES